jgi:hypothetical protein
MPLPVENGIRLVFETRRPGAPLPATAFAHGRLALAGVEIALG